jgi:multimeric flavodoxin WrbA
MSKVLLLNGSPHPHGCTDTALREVGGTLQKAGVECEFRWIGTAPVAGCIACGKCKTAGRCIFDDQVNQILEHLDEYSALVVGSPVYYAGPAGQLCAFLDRLFYCGSKRMAGKFGAAVVSCRRGGASAAFDRLNKYFTICSMPVVSSQYWNQVHGLVPEDVGKDLEGLQTMRTLGQNLAWLLACREAGVRSGVPLPQYEPGTPTNFIR